MKTKPDIFKRPVNLRTADEACSWKRHFAGGSCLRELIGILDKMAAWNPHRFVYGSVAWLVKKCNGKYRKGGARPFSKQAVMNALAMLKEEKIVSNYCRGPIEIGGREVWRGGWIVAPHDFMTERNDTFGHWCNFAGFPNPPIPGFPLSERCPKIWVKEYGEGHRKVDRDFTETGPARYRKVDRHATEKWTGTLPKTLLGCLPKAL